MSSPSLQWSHSLSSRPDCRVYRGVALSEASLFGFVNHNFPSELKEIIVSINLSLHAFYLQVRSKIALEIEVICQRMVRSELIYAVNSFNLQQLIYQTPVTIRARAYHFTSNALFSPSATSIKSY
jgi:hypothetical protein